VRQAILILALPLLLMALAGCGSDKSAKGTAQSFVQAMQKGQFKTAALLLDYETDARAQNSDWDSFPPSQRKLIIGRLADERATSLQTAAGQFGGVKVADVSESGEQAKATLEGGAVTTVDLIKLADGWRISDYR
jgi:hypothetical protein